MQQPAGRRAPDSVFPPPIVPAPSARANDIPIKTLGTLDLVSLAVTQLVTEFALHPERTIDSMVRLRLESLPDEIRKAFLFKLMRGGSRDTVEHRFEQAGVRIAVEATNAGREGVTLKLIERTPLSPASAF
ncbi:MAG: hypothetical protein ABIO72_01295 [Patescibacteria group bacterium]